VYEGSFFPPHPRQHLLLVVLLMLAVLTGVSGILGGFNLHFLYGCNNSKDHILSQHLQSSEKEKVPFSWLFLIVRETFPKFSQKLLLMFC
jgi:hypothetical protein